MVPADDGGISGDAVELWHVHSPAKPLRIENIMPEERFRRQRSFESGSETDETRPLKNYKDAAHLISYGRPAQLQ